MFDIFLCICAYSINKERHVSPLLVALVPQNYCLYFPKRVASPRLLLLRLKKRIVLGDGKGPF